MMQTCSYRSEAKREASHTSKQSRLSIRQICVVEWHVYSVLKHIAFLRFDVEFCLFSKLFSLPFKNVKYATMELVRGELCRSFQLLS